MALTLSRSDITAFAALQQALLSPLDHRDIDDWCRTVLRRAEALFHGDRSAILVPLRAGIRYLSESIDPASLRAFEQSIAELQAGAIRFSDVSEDQAWAARRAHNLEVWNVAMVARLAGVTLDDSPTYREAVKPAGIEHGPVASTALATGEAFLGVACSEPRLDPFGDEASLQLMAMVLPAFKAGVHALVSLDDRRRDLARVFDDFADPLIVCDFSGRELQRNRRAAEVLAVDSDRQSLINQALALARLLARRRAQRINEPTSAAAAVDVNTPVAQYRIRGTYAPAGLFASEGAILISLEKLTTEVPSPEQLAARYGLTARQASVAVLLAYGLSNREIGERLGLSPFTIRHHTEWIFTKLGVHTRKALALTLMQHA